MSSLRRTVHVVQPDPLAWEKQRGEGAKAFAAFQIYRDMGSHRSLTKVVRVLHESGMPGNTTTIGQWSSRWRWVERADAFDREQDRTQREEHNRAIADARRTEAMAGTLMLGAAIRRLVGDADSHEGEAVTRPLDLNELGAGDVPRLADVGSKLIDKGLGIAPGSAVATSVSGRAIYDLTRALLTLGMDTLEAGMHSASDSNGNLGALITLYQEQLIEEAGTLYTKAM